MPGAFSNRYSFKISSFSPASLSPIYWIEGAQDMYSDTTATTHATNGATVLAVKDRVSGLIASSASSTLTRSGNQLKGIGTGQPLTTNRSSNYIPFSNAGSSGKLEFWHTIDDTNTDTSICFETGSSIAASPGIIGYFQGIGSGQAYDSGMSRAGNPANYQMTQTSTAISANTRYVFRTIIDLSVATSCLTVYQNGTIITNYVNNPSTSGAISDNYINIGARDGGTLPLLGSFTGLIVIARGLTNTEATNMQTYLMALP